MGAIAFDTYKFIKRLEKSGFKEDQAEALSEAIKEVQETHMEKLATKYDVKDMATKSDIAELRESTKLDIAELRESTKLDIAEVKGELRLLKWMIGFMLAGVLSLVLKTFFA